MLALLTHYFGHFLAFTIILFAVYGVSLETEPCINDYVHFEREVVKSDGKLTHQLKTAFYTPNKQFPYTVVVKYLRMSSNGTQYIVSTDPTCDSQLWSWNSANIFSIAKPTAANIYSLFTLNYFRPLKPPHVDIAVPHICPNVTYEYLLQMTASLHKYATGGDTTDLGYIEMGCGTHESNTMFHYPYKGTEQEAQEYILYYIANTFPGLFVAVVILTAVFIATPRLDKILEKNEVTPDITQTSNSSRYKLLTYKMYGLPWGIVTSTTIIVSAIFFLDMYITLTSVSSYYKITVFYFTVANFVFVPLVPNLLPTFYMWRTLRKKKLMIPCIFLIPATLVCCGSKQRGKNLVLGLSIFVMLFGFSLLGIHGMAIGFSAVASPHAVGLSTTIMVLIGISVTDIFALFFTIGAYYSTEHRPQSEKTTITNAVILIPLLFSLIIISLVSLYCCSSVTVQLEQNRLLATLGSLPSPIIGILVVYGQRKLIAYATKSRLPDSKWECKSATSPTNIVQLKEEKSKDLDSIVSFHEKKLPETLV